MRKQYRSASMVTTSMVAAFLLPAAFISAQKPSQNPRAWMNDVRIGAYGLSDTNAAQIVRQAMSSGVYGIEVDNDIPGRYESFLDPAAKLQAIQQVAKLAHQHGNHAFVYIAG